MVAARVATALLPIVLVVGLTAPRAATTAGEVCAAAKQRLAGRAALRVVRCQAAIVRLGGAIGPRCRARVRDRRARGWARVEAPGGCATSGDATAIAERSEVLVADLEAALGRPGVASRCGAEALVAAGWAAECALRCDAE